MKKTLVLVAVLLIVTMFCSSVLAGSGPAPNSGDGDPDGSGWDIPPQNGDSDAESKGPAPNSGDGIPDGSGF